MPLDALLPGSMSQLFGTMMPMLSLVWWPSGTIDSHKSPTPQYRILPSFQRYLTFKVGLEDQQLQVTHMETEA